MKTIHLVVVGRLKDKNLEALEKDFVQRIKSVDFQLHELKSNAEDKVAESQLILKKIRDLDKRGSSRVIGLTEFGQERDSVKFSGWLYERLERSQQLIFLIAGAEGFHVNVTQACDEQVSLSKLTFPHKLARLLFIEQLYRAITIKEGHPYHN